ncbi:MAG: hypothetical protein KME42_13995 [Tildeniella nuda ZEHNDER 1965/U140]|jgi:hypothetical protein|nr:hypothetical protein [Tildeniella nuda ZEHNDER 1965/U140]
MHLTYKDVLPITRRAFNFTQRLLYAHSQPYKDWLIIPTATPEGRFAFRVFDPDGMDWTDPYGENYVSLTAALEMGEHYINLQLAELEESLRESD